MDAFDLYVKIGADIANFESGLSKAANMGKSVLGGIGKVAKVGMGVATAAIGAGTAAMGAFGKQSLDAYASYEQLSGGVEKLFGKGTEATKKLMENAEKAYMTAGMSSNKYMETATNFSASLLKSLDGDAEKAAEITDVAMRAMSDNINTFGTDSEAVSNAIMGLAKNNFTMIDNLKLGFSGSKEGMQQLIDRANELREANGEMGDLSIEKFSDMIVAIQTVQEDLGVAGTTAKEAMTTIEGSATATKAAWENLVTAIGRGEGMKEAMSGLKDAIFGVGLTEDGKETGLLNQIIPRINTIMQGAGQFIVESSPLIAQKIPELVEAVVPSLLEGGISLAMALGQGIYNALPSLWTSVQSATSTIGGYLFDGMDKAAKATENIDFTTPMSTALDKIDELLNGEKTQTFIENGFKVVENVAKGIGESAPTVIPKAAEVVTNFAQGITDNIPTLLEGGEEMVIGLAEGVLRAAPKLLLAWYQLKFKVIGYVAEMAVDIVSKAAVGFANLVSAAARILPQLPEKVAYYAGYAVTRFFAEIGKLIIKAGEVFLKVIDKAVEFGNDLKEKGEDAAKLLTEAVEGGLDNLIKSAWEKAKEIGAKIWEGITSKISGIADYLSGLVNSGIQGASDAAHDAAGKPRALNSSLKNLNLVKESENSDSDVFADDEKGINYEALGSAIVKAFVDADIKMEVDNREFGRLVRKVVTA